MLGVFRAAQTSDLSALYDLSKETGGGLTNLPPDKGKLETKLADAACAFARTEDTHEDDRFLFVLEDITTGRILGTCQVFSHVGTTWPFYSFRKDTFAQYNKELGRTVHSELLTLSTELGGCSEVGGLFLHSEARSAGMGMLLARSRYLFIRAHRARFAARVVAELRGLVDEYGNSPFWDAVGGRFFGMSFREADEFNGVQGNQFIADLMPKHPLYIAMLPTEAQEVIGMPHISGRPAMRMLEKEGFAFENHVDIFDAGPTMTARTDDILSIHTARAATVVSSSPGDSASPCILAAGSLASFRASFAHVSERDDGILVEASALQVLGASIGDPILFVER
ncbi:arginine N-succinyltransferase [Novosphingobium sp. SG751A]|uniref:arginine N-succinyltransferase n=1 Tax=Novosphingobium sp. SG751A TaxID=2587000 RepID=UPI001557A8DD|nr:arginine N-succinyltransferase [Novosphingobium sp. SG751A]NOW44945.1 arginine N-succinyltransferase [Novosphingobium sp. SG751A]